MSILLLIAFFFIKVGLHTFPLFFKLVSVIHRYIGQYLIK